MIKVGEVTEQTLHSYGSEDENHVVVLESVLIEFGLYGAEHSALGVLNLLLVKLSCYFERSAFGKREEILLGLVLRHHGEQFRPVTACAEEDLTLAILHELLNVENHFLRDSEVLHVFGESDTEFLAEVEKMFDGIA